MKIKIPSKTVEACDICHRETKCLDKCLLCGKEYCYVCEPYLPGCRIKPNVCKNCDDRDDVKRVVAKYAKEFTRIDKLREQALARLPKTPKKESPK